MKVHFGRGGVEKVIPFKYKGSQYYAEFHCACGLIVCDKNKMGVFVDHPAHIYAAKRLDKGLPLKN